MTRIGSLCSGYEGLGMAVQAVLGGELAWVADNDPGACKILAHRFPSVPNLGDITAIDWARAEPVDILTAGFPCQDISCAGKRAGLREGTRSGIWSHVARAIAALRPPLVVIENVKELLSERADSDVEQCPWCLGDTNSESAVRALGAVLADLAEIGFDAEWVSLPAAATGACHLRWRVFVLAWPAADAAGLRAGEPADEANAVAGSRGARLVPGGRGTGIAADAARLGRQRHHEPPPINPDGQSRPGPRSRSRLTPANATGDGRHQGGTESARLVGGPDAAVGGREPAADAERDGFSRPLQPQRGPEWGDAAAWHRPGAFGRYEAAVRQHERAFGRLVPSPVEPGRSGDLRLSPRFVEWMQGLPDGWVTDVPGLSRNAQLRALGNGVVPQQAAMALRLLLGAVEAGRAA